MILGYFIYFHLSAYLGAARKQKNLVDGSSELQYAMSNSRTNTDTTQPRKRAMSNTNQAAGAQANPFCAFIEAQGGTITPDQFRSWLALQGITMADWARERGFRPREVSLVLNGQIKARYGRSFSIAVAMGLKPDPNRAQKQHAA
ncbi:MULTISPECIES: DNA-binding protein [unclassified Methylococcus]